MMLIFPLAVSITIVMSTLAGCRLRLASGWCWLNVLHSCSRVSGSILVRYHHEVSHCLWLSPVELVLQQDSFSASVREVANGLFLAHSFARVAQLEPSREVVVVWLVRALLAEGQLPRARWSLVSPGEGLDKHFLEIMP
jgi:hypothetical protein